MDRWKSRFASDGGVAEIEPADDDDDDDDDDDEDDD